ncbi:hypothetical protein SANTM175S_01425 [Streptomyces antimycoticus]
MGGGRDTPARLSSSWPTSSPHRGPANASPIDRHPSPSTGPSPHQIIGLMLLFSPSVRLWLLPNVLLLVALSTWGALRYPHLPGRIPKHIGANEIDAWTDKTIGSAFVLVFVYAGVTVLMAGSAELTLRLTPRDELSNVTATPFATARATSSLLNRPGSRDSGTPDRTCPIAAQHLHRYFLPRGLRNALAFHSEPEPARMAPPGDDPAAPRRHCGDGHRCRDRPEAVSSHPSEPSCGRAQGNTTANTEPPGKSNRGFRLRHCRAPDRSPCCRRRTARAGPKRNTSTPKTNPAAGNGVPSSSSSVTRSLCRTP